jgi:hypothetical protein
MRGALAPRGAESTESWYPADPDEGDSRNNPVGRLLLQHPRLAAGPAPVCCISSLSTPGRLSADDTATWGLRVDYVLPSRDLVVIGSEVVRHSTEADEPPSDHFLVWIEVKCP